MNPARALRSKLRLEEFKKKKVQDEGNGGQQQQAGSPAALDDAGDTSNTPNMLIVNLKQTTTGKTPLETRLNSPIPQVDGSHVSHTKEEVFSFKSDYGEEDIIYSLDEIFPANVPSWFPE